MQESGEKTGLLTRLGNPLEWDNASKCAATAAVMSSFLIYQQFAVGLVLKTPDLAPYIHRGWLQTAAKVDQGFGLAWVFVLLASLYLRRKDPQNRNIVHVTTQVFALAAAWAAYFTGLYTFPWATVFILTGGIVGFLLFETRIVLWGCATGIILILATTVFEIIGMIPSAPFFAEAPPPYETRNIPLEEFLLWAPLFLTAQAFVLGAFVYTITRWRDREERLAETSRLLRLSNLRLTEATNLIRRYVPFALAEKILAGDYKAREKPERRVVTVFFSDIRGFTEASETLPADRLSEILNEYLGEMASIARKYDGTIDKYVGDAVMVFFGAPEFREEAEQARLAVSMALEMNRRMVSLRRKWKEEGVENPFEIRMGINTGSAHVGNFGSPDRMNYTVIGHHVNLAARLESHSKTGGILISESTYGWIHGDFACENEGEVRVKGVRDPVQVYSVVIPHEPSGDSR